MNFIKTHFLILTAIFTQSLAHAGATDLRMDNIKSLKGLILYGQPKSILTEGCSLDNPEKCHSTTGVTVSPRFKDYVLKNLKSHQDNKQELARLSKEVNWINQELTKTLDQFTLEDLNTLRTDAIKAYNTINSNLISPKGIYGQDLFAFLSESDDRTTLYHTFVMANEVNTSEINPYTKLAFAIKSGSEMKMTVKVYAQFPWAVTFDARSEEEQKLALVEEIDADCVATKNVNNYMFVNTRFQFKTSNSGVVLKCTLADNRGVLNFWANKRD